MTLINIQHVKNQYQIFKRDIKRRLPRTVWYFLSAYNIKQKRRIAKIDDYYKLPSEVKNGPAERVCDRRKQSWLEQEKKLSFEEKQER